MKNIPIVFWGYPYPESDDGTIHVRGLQGPEYMRLMRKLDLEVERLNHTTN